MSNILKGEDTRLNLIYELGDGEEVNVFDLAPTLLAWGELIQESNHILYPNGQEIAVNVKPFKEGSFVIDIVLFPSFTQNILSVVMPISLDQIIELLKTIGAIGGTGVSVLAAIRALRGKIKKVEEVKPGEYRYSSDNNSITVQGSANQLLQNSHVVQNIYNVYAQPLKQGEFSKVTTYLKDEKESTSVVVPVDDVPVIEEYASSVNLLTEGEKILEDEYTAYLKPKRGSFDGDGSSWSFWKGDKPITVTIKDEKFLKACASGEIRPSHNDLMVVKLYEKQRASGTTIKPPIYEIREVLEYIIGPKQDKLPFENQSKEPPLLEK